MNWLDPVYAVMAAATAPVWARKARGGWRERFGRVGPLLDGDDRPRVLLHAVSVGEVSALRELVPLLTPHVRVVVSSTTDTGLRRAQELFGGLCDVVRYPLDASWAVRRFLDAIRPAAVGLVELEVWPNFVRQCRERGIAVGVINGRLSERAWRGYRRVGWFFRRVFAALDFVAAQDDQYAERFIAVGVDTARCVVLGSLKWDAAKIADDVPGSAELARSLGIVRGPGSPPLVVGGSTAEGEEVLLRAACPPGVQLLCAPRRPERFESAAAALAPCRRRTQETTTEPASRFLLDTIGELRQAYALADVVVVGRTFADLGGSDPIEPVALGKATIVGPSVANFAGVVRALESAGGIARATRQTLPRVLARLLASPQERQALAERGRACIRAHQGASARHADLILRVVRRFPVRIGTA